MLFRRYVTFAQDASAQHELLALSAVQSGSVDFVLPPEEIAREVARIARHSYLAGACGWGGVDPSTHSQILEMVRGATGVDFTHYKASTLDRRILRRMLLYRLETPTDYLDYLRQTPEEVEALYQDILISVTSFFRDPEAYEALARSVFPRLISACPRGDVVRVWVAGCSSGEEAYSLAMVFAECAEALGGGVRLQLFATDVNPRCVEKARVGWYPRTIAQQVSPERLLRFFSEEGGGFRVRKALREPCIFSRHNLLSDPPFSRMDFVSCRNLLIYLEPVLQLRVMPLFYYSLKPGGWLWLGSSESVGTARTLFESSDLRHKTFTRRPGGGPGSLRRAVDRTAGAISLEMPVARPTGHGALYRHAETLLVAKYAPPSVVVSTALDIVQFQGDTSPYLVPASGVASHHLLKMLREGLAGSVREAIERAHQQGLPVRIEGLRVRSQSGVLSLAVEVIPLISGTDLAGGFVVLFDSERRPSPPNSPYSRLRAWWARIWRANDVATTSRNVELLQLSRELTATRESLQAVREQHESVAEELRSANEEAQSANEEMQSVNEELETSKEEMHASNEELATLNEELAERNGQLSRLTEELRAARDYSDSIVANARVPFLVLGMALTVKSANPAFFDRFRLSADETIGHPIYELGNGQWEIPALRRLLEEKLPDARVIEDYEVRHQFESLGPLILLLNASRLPPAMNGEALITLSIEDITTHVVAGETRSQLAAIVESSDDAIIGKGLDGVIKSWNRGAQRLFGYTAEEIIGRHVTVLIPSERQDEEAEIIRHIQRGEWVEHFETVRRRKDGTFLDVSLSISPIVDDAGRIIGASKIARDITSRKQTEAALRESEARYRAIGESIDYGVWVCAPDGRNIYASESFLKLVGITQEQCSNFGWGEILHPDDAERTLTAWRECVRIGGKWDREHRFRGVDGQWHPVLARGVPVRNELGEVVSWAGINLDISSLKRAEKALHESEERFRLMANAISQLAWIARADGHIFWYNQRWYDYTGARPEAMEGWGWQTVHDPRELPKVLERWRASIATGEPFEMTFPLRRADGVFRLFLTRSIPLKNAAGDVMQWFGTNTDVDELKRMETALATRAAALAQADRSKDEFLAMLAHELRNPLAPVRNAAEILQSDAISEEERAEAQRTIGRQIENMSRIVDDLLDVSRISEGKIELRRETVALEAILASAISVARPGCAARGQKLSLLLPTEPLFVDADATRLDQVFGNLLNNASKYSGEGSRITLSAERDGSEVVIRVTDDGIGIPAELLPRIFDLFVQASRTLDRAHGGLGIGLTVVQRLVRMHGGSVQARSEGPGRGSEFAVRLPVIDRPPTPPSLPMTSIALETRRRVLIVDDNRDAGRSLSSLHQRWGHDTRMAFTGPAAVALAAEFEPDVVLLDIGLPGMDGYEVARRLRAMPKLSGSLLIAMSGYGREEDRARARFAGFNEYLTKPMDLRRLRQLLSTLHMPTSSQQQSPSPDQ